MLLILESNGVLRTLYGLPFFIVWSLSPSEVGFLWWCMLYGSVVEPHPLQFFPNEPDTKQARNFIVVENIGVDGIDRHGWATRFQNHKVA